MSPSRETEFPTAHQNHGIVSWLGANYSTDYNCGGSKEFGQSFINILHIYGLHKSLKKL